MALAHLLQPVRRAAASRVLTALQLVDHRVIGRLPHDSVVRRAWARPYGLVDHAISAHVAHHSSSTAAHDVPPDRPATRGPSSKDEPETVNVGSARETASAEVEDLTENLLTAQETAPLVGELAEDDDLREVQAALNAKRLVAEQHEQHPDAQ